MKLITIQPMHYQLLILLTGLIALYFPFLQTMVEDWGTNDNYSHGYLIPFISAYMIYSLRKNLMNTAPKPATWGLLLIVFGLLQLMAGKIGSEFFLQRTSFIIVLFGIVLFILGLEIVRVIWLPLAYLLFMVPLPAIIWNRIAFPMQLFSSAITEQVVQFMGIPVYREGNVLHLTQTTLQVVDACSGLRSLITMLALSAAMAFLVEQPKWKRWVLFVSAVPIAVIINIIRLSGTAVLASRFGGEVAQGFLHDFSGILVFIGGILLLIACQAFLSNVSSTKKNKKIMIPES